MQHLPLTRSIVLMSFLVVPFCVFSAFAAIPDALGAGTLDPTFGDAGKVTTALGGMSSDAARGVAIQPDGKIVTAGVRSINSTGTSVIIRYNADGTLDTGFDLDGILILPMSTSGDSARSVVLQPDGKILVCGMAYVDTVTATDIYVVRLNTDGSLDTTFGSSGKKYIDFNGFNDYGNVVQLQTDGKIVIGGRAGLLNYADFGVARLNSDGSFDASFGTGGKVTTTAFQFEEFINDLKLQPDGKIVAVGQAFTGIGGHFFTVRYNADGSLDASFDGDGKAIADLGVTANAVEIYPDGKIVVIGVGSNSQGINDDFILVRYNADGSLDLTFGSGGTVRTAVGSNNDDALGAVLLPDGKVLVAGSVESGSFKFALVRYDVNGSVDTSFNSTGVVLTALGPYEDKAASIARKADGKIILAGSSFNAITERDFAIVGYLPDGSPDPSIGFPGRVTTSIRGVRDSAADVVVQPDGKLIAVGTSRSGSFDDFAICRYTANGELDPTFGSTGRVTISLNAQDDGAYAVALQTDGKIVAAGYSGTGNSSLAIVRFNANGSLDQTFGSNGRVIRAVGAGRSTANDVTIQPDGKIVTAGFVVINGSIDFAVERFDPDGSLDISFDFDGIVTTPMTDGNDSARSVAIQSDGKILVGGDVNPFGQGANVAVSRYNSDGSLDSTFGIGGKALPSIPGDSEQTYAMALQRDGKIVLAGSAMNGEFQNFALSRLNTNGNLDLSFGSGGWIVTELQSGSNEIAKRVMIQRTGKIILTGTSVSPVSDTSLALARYDPNGSLDTSFGQDGTVLTNYGASDADASAAVLQRDGKIVMTGGINISAIRCFALWRYVGDPIFSIGRFGDYDGDGRADLSVRRPSDNIWYIQRGTAGYFNIEFGVTGDLIAPADYDGDGKTDVAVFRPSNGTWYIFNSASQSFSTASWGADGDMPVPADHDGDGKADMVVFRPSTSTWYTRFSEMGNFSTVGFGVAGDKPVVGDFDGDGKADIALYRPSDNNWYILKTGFGFFVQTWGEAGDIPVPADYDGDGKTDVAVFRPSTGQWFRIRSTAGFDTVSWGANGDKPIPADYDGDGKADVAVFRPSNSNWFIVGSNSGQSIQQYGVSGDVPTEGSFIY